MTAAATSRSQTEESTDMRTTLQPGIQAQLTYTVGQDRTVPELLPESSHFAALPPVLATGYLVALVEWPCMKAVDGHLDADEQTFGVHVDLSHRSHAEARAWLSTSDSRPSRAASSPSPSKPTMTSRPSVREHTAAPSSTAPGSTLDSPHGPPTQWDPIEPLRIAVLRPAFRWSTLPEPFPPALSHPHIAERAGTVGSIRD